MSENSLKFPEGSQTAKALALYQISSQKLSPVFIRKVLLIKKAAALCNRDLQYLSPDKAQCIVESIDWLLEDEAGLKGYFPLDAWQGGAGTSINMNANEAIALLAQERHSCTLDPLLDVNMHQSTNDVLPTALRLYILEELKNLENQVAVLQTAVQEKEQAWSGRAVLGHTQLQDAILMDAGKIPASWAGALARDRWRIFKARERLKEVNLGGTALGSGAGAPRSYVHKVIQYLQNLCSDPICRADDPVEATSNYDCISEALESVSIFAQNLRKLCQDIRLLSSGPHTGFKTLVLPRIIKGSSIMPDKNNPVIPELGLQIAERLLANQYLIMHLGASSELQLNAFFPLILQTCRESLELASAIAPSLASYIAALELNTDASKNLLQESTGLSLALSPLIGYYCLETALRQARKKKLSLLQELSSSGFFPKALEESLSSVRLLLSQGYDEKVYADLEKQYCEELEQLKAYYKKLDEDQL